MLANRRRCMIEMAVSLSAWAKITLFLSYFDWNKPLQMFVLQPGIFFCNKQGMLHHKHSVASFRMLADDLTFCFRYREIWIWLGLQYKPIICASHIVTTTRPPFEFFFWFYIFFVVGFWCYKNGLKWGEARCVYGIPILCRSGTHRTYV
jgi:hypothetical protein